jgi:5-methyltetrahydrofolate--homocysteine methyltransferase
LATAIEKGLSESAALITERLLTEKQPMDIVNCEIIPALDKVGVGFENGKLYLPSLLKSAEAAKCAFEKIKLATTERASDLSMGRVVIATVKGDIHDIGKNIVKLLLENYGFRVIDLGKDVSAEKIAEASVQNKADIIALSALMTTTVAAMEETIKLLKKEWPTGKIIVGGAVLTAEHASRIGADAYAKDAMGAVRYAEKLVSEKKENDN